MRRSATLLLIGLAVVGGCSDDDNGLGPNRTYDVQTTESSLTLAQDFSDTLDVTVIRDGEFTVDDPLITYVSDDYTIATVTSAGVVTAKKGGQTNIRAAFNGDTLVIPLTVTPRPATSVELTINFTGRDKDTLWALPGFPAGAVLKAVVKAGADTVYCNALACRNHATRVQRLVEFVSLDTMKATVADVFATTTNKNNRGQVTARDTSAALVPFVLRVPADNIADTVWLSFSIRPIDSITVRTDSFTVAGADDKVAYTSNITRDSSITLAVNMLNRTDTAYTISSSTGNPIRTRRDVTVIRPTPPRVTWESANGNYAVVDNQGRVTGLRNTWMPNDAPTCSAAVYKTSGTDIAYNYDRVLTLFPIPANYTPAVVPTGCPATVPGPNPGDPPVPTNVPANVARGVHCTSSTATPTATCTVVIRATITDPASGATRRAHFVVIVRQP